MLKLKIHIKSPTRTNKFIRLFRNEKTSFKCLFKDILNEKLIKIFYCKFPYNILKAKNSLQHHTNYAPFPATKNSFF